MIPYWLLFGYFLLGMLLNRAGSRPSHTSFFIGGMLIALMIGLRYEVGADWQTYEFLFEFVGRVDLSRAMEVGDPGYQFVSWNVRQLGQDIWLTNLLCASIFTWGLVRFARTQADPWLALVVAIPYLVIVVAMGYTRQAVAIGVIMSGLAALQRGAPLLKFTAYVAVAALFHRTAIAVLPLVVLAADRNRLLNTLAGVAVGILFYDLFLSDSLDQFVNNYIGAKYNSQGAAIRVGMSLVPATVFLLARKKLRFSVRDDKIWRNFSLAAWALLVFLLLSPSSTAVDRLALYVIPLQLAVLSAVPTALGKPHQMRLVVASYSALVLFVWLNFAAHARFWMPYQIYWGH